MMPNTVALPSITPEQTQMRIQELMKLDDGWLNGLGKALAHHEPLPGMSFFRTTILLAD